MASSRPRAARPGDYLSGVSVETPGTTQTTARAHRLEIGEAYRYVVGVETRLPGPRRPHIRFTGALVARYPSSVTFLLLARNDGNVILKNVHGWVMITRGGSHVISQTIAPGTFVSHTSIELPVATPHQHPSAGTRYRVRAELIYQGGIAYLDTGVIFGHRAAQIQAQYTGRGVVRSGTPWWPLAAAAIAALLALAGLWWAWRRRRRPLSRRATVSLLERRLARARKQGTVLSLVCLDLMAPASQSLGRRVAEVVRPALRGSDAVGDLGGGHLLVILPGTGESLAKGLADELTTTLQAAGLTQMVSGARPLTPGADIDLAQLLAQLAPQGHDDQTADYRGAAISA